MAELTTALAREFLQAYPTPAAVPGLTERQWQRWARAHRLSEARTQELWAVLQRPQLPVPAHVVRAKARLMEATRQCSGEGTREWSISLRNSPGEPSGWESQPANG